MSRQNEEISNLTHFLQRGDPVTLSSLTSGSGVDVIACSAGLGHLYLPGATSKTMATLGVSAKGELSLLGTVPTAAGAHCATTDARGNVHVCAPARGKILAFHDAYSASL